MIVYNFIAIIRVCQLITEFKHYSLQNFPTKKPLVFRGFFVFNFKFYSVTSGRCSSDSSTGFTYLNTACPIMDKTAKALNTLVTLRALLS